MLLLLSPSKTLDETPVAVPSSLSEPDLLKETVQLHKILKSYSVEEIKALMKVSDKIASLNVDRFQAFTTPFTEKNAKPALFMFKGDVYDPIEVAEYSEKELRFANQHIRILSGFYGLLRPLDLMQPYRLEMGTKLENSEGKNLYAFWGDKITDAINHAETDTVLNLASEEYFKAVNTKKLKAKLIHVQFKDWNRGEYRVVGLHAKKARGMMANDIVKRGLTEPEQIKSFHVAGYGFAEAMSDEQHFIFTRRQVSAA